MSTHIPRPSRRPGSMDPLAVLPAEIVLRILEFASLGSIAALIQTTRSWQAFIDHIHQDAIYAAHLPRVSPAITPHEYMGALKAFRPSSVSRGVKSWKEACRRRCLLQDAWNSPDPMPVASVIQIGIHPVWRFKPDFDRRLIMSTSQAGGVNVTDMDTGDLLWSLGRHEVRPFAHLEYQNGTAVWVCIILPLLYSTSIPISSLSLYLSASLLLLLLTQTSHTGPLRQRAGGMEDRLARLWERRVPPGCPPASRH